MVEGCFAGDGHQHYAIAGKYDNPRDPENSSFILIVTHSNGEFIRKYLTPVVSDRVFLEVRPKCRKGRDGVGYALALNSDHGAILVWDGEGYITVTHCDEEK